MLNIQELEKLEEVLKKEEITYEEANKKIYEKNTTTKTWHTSEWKKERNKLIKDYCEQ